MAAQAFDECPAALSERAQLVSELLAVMPNRRGFKVHRDGSVAVYPVPSRHAARLSEQRAGARTARPRADEARERRAAKPSRVKRHADRAASREAAAQAAASAAAAQAAGAASPTKPLRAAAQPFALTLPPASPQPTPAAAHRPTRSQLALEHSKAGEKRAKESTPTKVSSPGVPRAPPKRPTRDKEAVAPVLAEAVATAYKPPHKRGLDAAPT